MLSPPESSSGRRPPWSARSCSIVPANDLRPHSSASRPQPTVEVVEVQEVDDRGGGAGRRRRRPRCRDRLGPLTSSPTPTRRRLRPRGLRFAVLDHRISDAQGSRAAAHGRTDSEPMDPGCRMREPQCVTCAVNIRYARDAEEGTPRGPLSCVLVDLGVGGRERRLVRLRARVREHELVVGEVDRHVLAGPRARRAGSSRSAHPRSRAAPHGAAAGRRAPGRDRSG